MGINSLLTKLGVRLVRNGTQSLDGSVDSAHIELVNWSKRVYDNQDAAAALVKRCAGYSMTSVQRLLTLYNLTKYLDRRGVPGDFVECGVWRGGSSGVMAGAHLESGPARRTLWLYDSFEGLPEPGDKDGVDSVEYAKGRTSGKMEPIDQCVAAEADATGLLAGLKFPLDRTRVVKGWFQNTIPTTRPDTIALLRLDGDWYESTKVCLDHLYDRVVPGGVVVIDDYGAWEGCKTAVDEFFVSRGGPIPFLHHIDQCGRYLMKE